MSDNPQSQIQVKSAAVWQAEAEASLKELGIPALPTGESASRVHGRIEQAGADLGKGAMEVDSTQSPLNYADAVATADVLAKRRAALGLTDVDAPTADALAQQPKFAASLVQQMHDAARALSERVSREEEPYAAFLAADSSGTPEDAFLVDVATRRVADCKEVRRTLAELSALSEFTPSTQAQRLQAVEDLRARFDKEDGGAGEQQ